MVVGVRRVGSNGNIFVFEDEDFIIKNEELFLFDKNVVVVQGLKHIFPLYF
jgi:hypothetical protein